MVVINQTSIKIRSKHLDEYTQELEQALLGSILLDSTRFPTVLAILSGDDFFLPRHRYIFEAMQNLYDNGLEIDAITVSQKLHELGRYDDSGGIAYLALITASDILNSTHLESYAKMIRNLSVRRHLFNMGDSIRLLALDPNLDTGSLVGKTSEMVDALAAKIVGDHVPITTYLGRVLSEIQEAMKPSNRFIIPTGLHALDELLGGYRRQMVHLIAGRTHNGKSSLAYHSVLAMARAGRRVALYNTADGDELTIIRLLLSIMTGITTLEFYTGITPDQYAKVVKAIGELAELPIFIKSDTNLTPLRLYNHARILKFKHGLDAIVVDYIQAMTGPSYMTVYERNTAIAQAMTAIAKKLNVALIQIAQINRAGAGSRPPSLDKVEGSGKYEQACQVGIIVHYDGMYDKNAPQNRLSIIVEKNKVTGRKGLIYARFNPNTTQITDWDTLNVK